MPDSVIQCEALGKSYLIGHQGPRERYSALRDVMARQVRGVWQATRRALRGQTAVLGDEIEEFWALRDVSFEVQQGEVVGIIGRNGAGKSTLLKILSRITEPTAGRVTIRGRVASLLEVGTGFHPELTGRENIFLNGAILGMSRGEIKRKFDKIVAFAEVERFLDTPVKRFSSGMYVRLAFAVAAHLEPEILLVDEVLAVGDAEFQKKCLGKMQDVSRGGRTVLFVSHNMAAVMSLCERVMLLKSGRIIHNGTAHSAIELYRTFGHVPETRHEISKNGFTISREQGLHFQFNCGDPITLDFRISSTLPLASPSCGLIIFDSLGNRVCGMSSKAQRKFGTGSHSIWDISIDLCAMPINSGGYTCKVYIGERETDVVIFDEALLLTIHDYDVLNCGTRVPQTWGHFYWQPSWTFAPIECTARAVRE